MARFTCLKVMGPECMTKLEAAEKEYLQSLETTLEEWLTPEDEAAYRDL